MFYKPNYCCSCGDKIERIEWNPLTSRRFCEVCETENPLDKLFKIIVPTILLAFSVFGISGYFQSNENSVGIKKSDKSIESQKGENKKITNSRTLKSSEVQDAKKESKENNNSFENKAKTDSPVVPVEQNISPIEAPRQVVISKSPQKGAEEAVYFCGAETKKGTPCSRKVKGGGRCWQHVGREAMLSAKELKVESKK